MSWSAVIFSKSIWEDFSLGKPVVLHFDSMFSEVSHSIAVSELDLATCFAMFIELSCNILPDFLLSAQRTFEYLSLCPVFTHPEHDY
jgi:hypothetical protein